MLYENLSVNAQGHLAIAGFDTTELAAQYGTPLYVMDEARIRARLREYRTAMQKSFRPGSTAHYASKALSCKRIYEIVNEEGLGVDVVSAGELHTAYRAGFPMEHVCFHGNNKTDFDIRYAMSLGVSCFVCDNEDELRAIDREAAAHAITQDIQLRLSPGIDPHTHAKIATGQIDSKFGAAIETGQAMALTKLALSCAHVRLLGFHCHIGSQIVDHKPFCDAAVIMLRFIAQVKKELSFEAALLNLGGGMAVAYREADERPDYAGSIRKVGLLIKTTCRELSIEPPVICMEPGRSIVADAGLTLYTVGGVKQIPGFKNYVSVDGGMTDNPRYALYQADYTAVLASRMKDRADFTCTLAGRCCESGDVLQENVTIAKPVRGDLAAVLGTGAYNYSMASNYNRVPRAPIVMLGSDGPYLAVRRESLDDLLLNDL